MDTAKVKEYVCLEKRKDDLDAELKQVEQDLKTLERVVVNEMVNAGFNEVERRWPEAEARSGRVRQPRRGPVGRRGGAQGGGTRPVHPAELQRLATRAAFVKEIAARSPLPRAGRGACRERGGHPRGAARSRSGARSRSPSATNSAAGKHKGENYVARTCKSIAAPLALTMPEEERQAVMAAFAVNCASGSITEFDLPRIKVTSGTALWLIPGLEGDKTAPAIEGVIVVGARHARLLREQGRRERAARLLVHRRHDRRRQAWRRRAPSARWRSGTPHRTAARGRRASRSSSCSCCAARRCCRRWCRCRRPA